MTSSFGRLLMFLTTGLGALTIVVGSGCQLPQLPSLVKGTATSTAMDTTAVQDATKKLIFTPSDSFEINQTFFGIGGAVTKLARLTQGTRTVTVTKFIPNQNADVSYETAVERETDASRTARAEIESKRLNARTSSTITLPDPVMERVISTGTIAHIELQSSHEVYLPAYWKVGQNDLLNEKSALWMSNDAFQELSRTKKTVLNFGILETGTSQLVKNVTEMKNAFAKLKQQAVMEEKKKDPMLVEMNGEQEEFTLVINGKDTTVSVIRAHNWFGEVVVLNNPKNPLILSMSFNPLTAGAAEIMGSEKGLKTLFGYQIKNLHLSAF